MMFHTHISWQLVSLMQFSRGSVDYLYWPLLPFVTSASPHSSLTGPLTVSVL